MHLGQGDDLGQRFRIAIQHGLGRAFGREEAIVGHILEARQAQLGEGGDVRQDGLALSPMTATMRILPALWFSMKSGTEPTPAAIWLPSMSAIIGALPR